MPYFCRKDQLLEPDDQNETAGSDTDEEEGEYTAEPDDKDTPADPATVEDQAGDAAEGALGDGA